MTLIRSGSFIAMLSLCLIGQWIRPSRPFHNRRWQFMASNLGIVFFNNIVIGFLPMIPYQMSVIVLDQSYGLLNMFQGPLTLKIIIGVLMMDVIIYFQHRIFHKVDWLWRLHSMHHIDPMLDVTSGLRFHPLEIVISNFIKVGAILLLGIHPFAIIIFEIDLNLLAMFNHSNIRIGKEVEVIINKVLITPALHTIHHSKILKETNSNYGFSVPWWDKLFGTFTAHGKYEQADIKIGTVPMPDRSMQLFPGMLIQPFIKVDNK